MQLEEILPRIHEIAIDIAALVLMQTIVRTSGLSNANLNKIAPVMTLWARLHGVHTLAPASNVEGRCRAAGTHGLDASMASEDECCCVYAKDRMTVPPSSRRRVTAVMCRVRNERLLPTTSRSNKTRTHDAYAQHRCVGCMWDCPAAHLRCGHVESDCCVSLRTARCHPFSCDAHVRCACAFPLKPQSPMSPALDARYI